jgi:hypothetical protein
MLKIRGRRVRLLQLTQSLDFVQGTCPWFPEEGTVNLETWNKVGDRLRMQYTAEGPECMSIFTFSLLSMIRDCLEPTPSHKERFSSLVVELGYGTHPLQPVIQKCKRQDPLQEQNAVGGGATEPSAPPYEGKFSQKIKIQSKDDSDSDSVSDEEGQGDTPAHRVLGTMHLGLPPQAKRLPTLAKSSLQAALQAACS